MLCDLDRLSFQPLPITRSQHNDISLMYSCSEMTRNVMSHNMYVQINPIKNRYNKLNFVLVNSFSKLLKSKEEGQQ